MNFSVLAEPANTVNYFIAGFSVIFGAIFVYWISLVVRARKLRGEEEMLEEIEKKESKPPVP